MTPRSVANWFAALYNDVGLDGCSSHSGCRTFITNCAKLVAKTGGTLRDVQELAGQDCLIKCRERSIAIRSMAAMRLVHDLKR